jgi:hypothetical protein
MDRLEDYLTEVGPSAEIADTETHDEDYAHSLGHFTSSEPTQIVYSYDHIIERDYNE